MSELIITFLGTSSGRPTLRRGCAAVSLQYGADLILFDCGEGTQLQIMKASVRTSKLKAICISHFHGDHINGLPGLLGTMGLGGHHDPVTISAPPGLPEYFRTLRKLSILRPSFEIRTVNNQNKEVFSREKYKITSLPLIHRIPTWGFRFDELDLPGRFNLEKAKMLGIQPGPIYGKLQRGETVTLDDGRIIQPSDVLGTFRKGRSFAYISDTRPSEKVVEFVKGVDLLVHEATYMHEFHEQAQMRDHSTTIEAATIAKKAAVGRLILTHISPKHMNRKSILDEARTVFQNSDVAEDLDFYTIPIPE